MSGIGHDRYRAERRAAARFPAKYPGKCAACGEGIHVGDELRWEGYAAVHADCGAVVAPDDETTETCPRCHMAVAVNGACDCDA
jgi:hypothetical protein